MRHLDLTNLKWIKVIHDPGRWAYTQKHIEDMSRKIDHRVINHNDVTIFPLGFRNDKAEKIQAADQVALIQKGKLTHLVEILDCEPYPDESGCDWCHRFCRVLWWQPNQADWSELPSQKDLLGFDPALQDGNPHLIEDLKRFDERWNDNGKMAGFRAFLSEQLTIHTQ